MRRILLYLLALAISIIIVAMFMSVILMPLADWLMEQYDWFASPFDMAYIVSDKIAEDKAFEKAKKKRLKEKDKMKDKAECKKYGIETCDEDEDFVFYWDDNLCYDEVSKEQVIHEFEGSFDELVDLGYSARDIYTFINMLKDEKDGDKAYENLCQNIAYLKDLAQKAYSISEDMGEAFDKYLWRKKEKVSLVMVLPYWLKFTDLLKETKCVKDWTESSYIDSDQRKMVDILIGKKMYNEMMLKYISDDFYWVEHLMSDAKERAKHILENIGKLADEDLSDDMKSKLKSVREKSNAILAIE